MASPRRQRWLAVYLASLQMVLVSCGSYSPTATVVQSGASAALQQPTNVLTYHNNVLRTGQNTTETTLTPANVNFSTFGKLFSVAVDGRVDAQPLYVSQVTISGQSRAVVFTATEHNSVYAFDATNGNVLWHVSLSASGEMPSDDRGCGQVAPEIGITATPVIDLSAGSQGTIYVLAMSRDQTGQYHHRLHALDLTTGQESAVGPAEIAATFPGSGDNSSNGQVVFDPKQYKSRTSMLLLNGTIYTGWGSHCDIRPYTGWLMAFDRLTLKQSAVFNFAPNGGQAALWNSGGGMAGDPVSGRAFVSVANGTFDVKLNSQGFPSQGDFGNAFVKLNLANGSLVPEDYWTMSSTVSESSQDEDLGSGGVLLLPDLTNGSGQVVQLGTGAGKDGTLYVFNRGNMGKFNAQGNSTLYQQLTGVLGGAVFASPAWFNGTVYYGAVGDHIRAFPVSAAAVIGQPSSMTENTFGYPGTSPSVSANGTSNAIVWAVENATTAVLHAYDATALSKELYNSLQASDGRDSFGAGNKFVTPTIADGHVIIAGAGNVTVFGLLK